MVLLSLSQTSWSLPRGMRLALLGTDLDGYSQLCVFWGESLPASLHLDPAQASLLLVKYRGTHCRMGNRGGGLYTV